MPQPNTTMTSPSPVGVSLEVMLRTKKGMKEMNDWFAPYEKIVEERERENFAVRLLKLGKMTVEEIAEATELAIAEVTRIAQTIKA